MSKGGSTSSSVEIPAWLENAAIENINRARDVQRIGYTPYYGPDVAAFSPMQTQAMQATGMGAEAFGLAPSGFDPMAGMPQAQEFAGGLMGYSSAPLYEQSVDVLRQQRPAQASALEGLFIDPVTGQYSAPSYAPTQEQIEQTAYTERARNAALDAALRQAEIDKMITAEDVASAVDDTLDYRFGDLTSGIQSAQRSIDDLVIPESATAQEIAEATDRQLNYRFGDLTDYVGGKVDGLGQDVNYQLGSLDIPVYDGPSTDDIVSQVLAGIPEYEEPVPSVVIGDTRYLLDPTMTPTMPTLGDTGSQVFTLDGELVEDTLTRPSTSRPIIHPLYGADPAIQSGITLGEQYTNDSHFNYDPVPESMTSGYTLGSRPEVVIGGGMPPPDVGLGDVVGNAAGLALNTGLLGTVTKGLTGSYPVQNTPEEATAIPVMDFGTVTSALPPVNTVASKPSKKKSSTSSLASQGSTGTYNQKYWADKLKSGASQAELKAEQDKIKAAGGKVYKGSTPSKPKTNKKSSSSTSSK